MKRSLIRIALFMTAFLILRFVMDHGYVPAHDVVIAGLWFGAIIYGLIPLEQQK